MKAKYTYDAYGNHTITNYDVSQLGDLNPFRYRGYYYDVETSLYYLQSRYYDPKIGRFISKDHLNYLDPKTIGGLNLYAYCGGNPVMYTDSSGCSPEFWMHILSGLMIMGGIALMFVPGGQILGLGLIGVGAGSFIGGNISEMNGESFASGWLIGGLIGFALGVGLGYALPYIGAFLGSTAFTIGVPSLTMTAAGTLAFATTTVAVSWGTISAALAGVAIMAMSYGANRFQRTNGNNREANKFIDYLQKKYGFDDWLRERLHREISKRGFSKKIIMEILKELLGL
ncbi:MAG: hypothetical protein LBR37_00780 [Erysipelotrichaceae bacterium]|nr:hypothetical protein [Erysipelotrichaceae bacterium]